MLETTTTSMQTPKVKVSQAPKKETYYTTSAKGEAASLRVKINENIIQAYYYRDLAKPRLDRQKGITIRDLIDNEDLFISGKDLHELHEDLSRQRVNFIKINDRITNIQAIPRDSSSNQQEMNLDQPGEFFDRS